MRPELVLKGLNAEQVAAVTSPAGPLVISAGAGTGKTRTVTSRIAYRVATGELVPQSVLAVTHSTRAAGQLREALRLLPVPGLEAVATRTVHAAALNQLKYFWSALELGGEGPVVCSDQFATVREVYQSVLRARVNPAQVSAVLAEISWAKASLIGPDGYAAAAAGAGRRLPLPAEHVVEIFERYQAALRTRRVLDHTDLLTGAARLVLEVPEVARAVQRRARFMVVDEYQDADPAQAQLLDAWRGDGDDLTVVGDARQAIYAFKGSDPALLTNFRIRHPSAVVVDLTVNYRSSPQIVAVANRLAAGLAPRGCVPVDLVAADRSGPTPSVRAFPDESSEAAWVAAQIAGNIRAGMRAGQAAVLVRDNARAAALSDALAAAQVPSWVSGGTRFFDAPEILAVRARMRAALGEGLETGGAALLRSVLADTGFDRDRSPEPGTAAAPVWRTRRALLGWVESLPSAELLGASHLLAEFDRAAAAGHQVPVDAVFVGTVHAAKGLEFDSVYSLGWDSTWQPNGQQGNLAYVAVTRARRHLTLTWSAARAGRTVEVSPLVPLAGFVAADAHTHLPSSTPPQATPRRGAGSRPVVKTGRCRRCKAPLDSALAGLGECALHLTGEAARVWSELLAWRQDRAVIESTFARRVLSDASALALVAHRPQNPTDLLAIPGIGPATVRKHGGELLAITRSA